MVGQCVHDVSVVSESELDRSVVGVADPDDQKQTIREVDLGCILTQLTFTNSRSSTMGNVGLPGLDVSTQSSTSSGVVPLTCSTRRASIVPSAGRTRLTVRRCRRDTKVALLT